MNKFSAQFQDEITQIITVVQARLDKQAIPATTTPRFDQLAQVFAITDAEADLLRCLIANHYDPSLRTAFEEWTGSPFVTEHLIRQAFAVGPALIYTSDSPLNIWRLVHPRDMGAGMPMAFELDIAVLEWLAGKPGLEPRLTRMLRRPAPTVDSRFDTQLQQINARRKNGAPLICVIAADEGADPTELLSAIAQTGEVTLWMVETEGTTISEDDLLKLHRFARVQNAALAWSVADPRYLNPSLVPATHLQFAPHKTGQVSPQNAMILRVPAPDRTMLEALLKNRFPSASAGQVRQAAAIKGLTANHISDPRHENLKALTAAQLTYNANALLDWAVPLPTTMRFDDLVLEDGLKTQLCQLVTEIRAHADLWQDPEIARVYAQERALTILLKGPPGTGKTLTARILAGEAGVPLYRVDAASLTSKYIGETAENMRALFAAANRSGAMLFIDEFEAIVGKRTETRNEIARSYNHDTAYFLQLIETQFEGVAIFATNRPAEIDEAMHRRIRKVFDFQPPEEAQRAALWQLALQPFAPSPALLEFAAVLAEDFPFSGSRIKSIVLNAYALGHGSDAGISITHLRSAALTEARNNGRLPAKRALMRLDAFGDDQPRGPLQ